MSATLTQRPGIARTSRRSIGRYGRLLQYSYAVLGFAVYSTAIIPILQNLHGDDQTPVGESDIISTIAQMMLLVGIVPAMMPYRNRLIRALRDLTPYLLILALCFLSAAWSPYPMITLRRSMTLSVCIFFGTWCYFSLGVSRTLRIYGRATVVFCILSIVVYVALPALGREVAEGYANAMRGVYSQKNILGVAAALAVPCYLFALYAGARHRVRSWLAILLLCACELLAKSATSMAITVVILTAAYLFYCRRSRRAMIAGVFVVTALALIGVAFLSVNPDAVFGVIDRDPSFTGRVPLWDYSIGVAMEHPLLGYGYSGFWVADATLVQWLWAMVGWDAPTSHNGYLDIVLQIGIVGLGLYTYVWTRVISLAWRANRGASVPAATWILLFMLLSILLNFDEALLPYPNQFTMMMPPVMLYLAAWRRNEQMRHRSARLATRLGLTSKTSPGSRTRYATATAPIARSRKPIE